MLLAASAFLIGVALGLRRNVFILVPASIVGAGVVFTVNVASQDSLWAALIAVSSIVALQVGYLAGTFVTAFTGERKDVVSAPELQAKNGCDGADVVYFHKHSLAKAQQ
jgi:hypothetical protein